MDPQNSPEAKDIDNLQDKQIFHSGKKKYEIELTSTELKWRVEGRRNEWKSCETRFLVGCKLDDKKDSKAKYFTFLIYYTSKNLKTEVWKCGELRLQHEDEQLLKKWDTQIRERIHEHANRPRSLLVFVNPMSGGKTGQSVYEKLVAPLFEKAGIKTQVIVTKGPSDIPETLNSFDLTKVDGIISAGGDGTYNIVVNTLLRRLASDNGLDLDNPEQLAKNKSDIPVGIIPCGTGQGMANAAFGAKDPITAALHVLTGGVIAMDTFSIHSGTKFVDYGTLFCGYGYMSTACKYGEENRKWGKVRYVYAIGKMFSENALKQIEIKYLPTENSSEANKTKENTQSESTQNLTSGYGKSYTTGVKNVGVYLLDLQNKGFTKNSLFLETWNESAGKWKIMKHLAELSQHKGSGYDTEYFSGYYCTEVQITLKDTDLSEEILNLDGEIYELKEPVLCIRYHNKTMKMYGHGSIHYGTWEDRK